MTWTNTGSSSDIQIGLWSIYFTHPAPIESNSMTRNGTLLGTSGLRVYHVNGALNKIEPTSTFQPIGPGQALVIDFTVAYAQTSRTDIYPNWYVVSQDQTCQDATVIASTSSLDLDFVSSFIRPNQWKKGESDTYNPYTPQQRYDLDYVIDKGAAQHKIIPTPVSQQLDEGRSVNIANNGWVIIQPSPELASEAQFLSAALTLSIVSPDDSPTSKLIFLNIDSINVNPQSVESYRLIIDSDFEIINITGRSRPGVFYGIQSLLSLSESTDIQGVVPHGVVTDGPRFEYRGMHLDVSRNFQSVSDLERLMDVMALYKMNKLHLHLSDDEGWRLEIPEIPELTEVASKRCHDLSGDECIVPQFGSAPNLPNAGSGFYSTSEYQSLLQYANTRHIEVIPEFDMPGHCHAAINAMLARYRKYQSTDPQKATEFLLSDHEDTSEYVSIQGYTDNAINPCIDSTYHFIETVVASVKALHESIQPLRVFHMGGDEVPRQAWTASPACASFDISTLKQHFITKVAQISSDAGVSMAVWEDGLYSQGSPIDKDSLAGDEILATVWDNVWEWGSGNRAYVLANGGYKVIIAHATNLYFDMPQEPDPEERGQDWATRVTTTKKVFGFIPDNIYENMGVDGYGYPIDQAAICLSYGCPPLEEDKRQNVIGIQGQLWRETIRTRENVDYMIYPRLLALAERSWHKSAWEDLLDKPLREQARDAEWTDLANTLGYKELSRLDSRNVAYRIPPPGVKINAQNVMTVSSGMPGLPRYYSFDGQTWIKISGDVQLSAEDQLQVVIRSTDDSRSSRSVTVTAGLSR